MGKSIYTVVDLLYQSSYFPSKNTTLTQQVAYSLYGPSYNKRQAKHVQTLSMIVEMTV